MRLLSLTLVSGRGLRIQSGIGARRTLLRKSHGRRPAYRLSLLQCCLRALHPYRAQRRRSTTSLAASTDGDERRERKKRRGSVTATPVALLLVSNAITGMMPARVAVGVSDVVPRIVINKSVVGVETIVACIGAPVAPIRVIPRRPDVLGARHNDRRIVCRVRWSRRTAESSRCDGCCKYQLFHFDDRYICHRQPIRFDDGEIKIAYAFSKYLNRSRPKIASSALARLLRRLSHQTAN